MMRLWNDLSLHGDAAIIDLPSTKIGRDKLASGSVWPRHCARCMRSETTAKRYLWQGIGPSKAL